MTTAFDPKTAPPSVFPAHDGAVYEQAMGRWSRRLAPLLIEFGGLADGDRVLDVGCGTGSLSYALPEAANVSAVTGIDQAEVYLAYARRRSADPRFISGTRMRGHCRLPMARSTAPFRCSTDVYPRCGACRR